MLALQSFMVGHWVDQMDQVVLLPCAITGEAVARLGKSSPDANAMRSFAKGLGGPALRSMTFHDRAKMLKALALYLSERKEALYDLSYHTGATLNDSRVDIDGGIGTLLAYAAKGRREMPDDTIYIDGEVEQLSRNETFLGQHVCTSLQGVALHINAFNFPVWGMLEKLAPCLLAGVPAIVKPASATAYLTEACFRMMIESGLLPEGSVQLICGSVGDMLEHLDCQDVVSFTGSADTALMLRSNMHLLKNSVRFIAEQDSLNATLLGPDIGVDDPEFGLFVKEIVREMTTKAGQKCTAIRRIIVPSTMLDQIADAVASKLEKTIIGDPRLEDVRMGALVSRSHRDDVLAKTAMLGQEAKRLGSRADRINIVGADVDKGAFMAPVLLHCEDPDGANIVHYTEAFGPVSTIMAYRDLDHGCALVNRGGGSLVASLVTNDGSIARKAVQQTACWHGRIYINNASSMKEATGHGAPMPQMVHGGPGRAGGGEELGGIRGVMHYMQRTAVQGSPDILTAVSNSWINGSKEIDNKTHPFTRKFGELEIGETLNTDYRQVTLDDIEHFAEFTGDTFYAHMDEEAAKANPFFPGRVAHGYLLLSFAAGLFVHGDPGPVLANTGLEGLKFLKPVSPGDSIRVRLTVKKKTRRNDEYGEVRWNVTLYNQDNDPVAEYELHTMNQY
jgi:oxepin-CoA hydrolase/3-oxo-5,6-dehydrosuberyl-CoA semialdehyde dehydrogenase